MGVSITLETKRGKEIDITPGWRSMMWSLLLDYGLVGRLTDDDLTLLVQARDNQRTGERNSPFSWSQDIADSFDQIIAAIKRDGSCVIFGVH